MKDLYLKKATLNAEKKKKKPTEKNILITKLYEDRQDEELTIGKVRKNNAAFFEIYDHFFTRSGCDVLLNE